MRALRQSAIALLLATSLVAQTPPNSAATRKAPVPVVRALSFDLAAALDHRGRVALEPLAFGRWTVGVTGMYTDRMDGSPPDYGRVALPGPLPPSYPCPEPGCLYGYGGSANFQEWSADFTARWYPAFLTVTTPQWRLLTYLGECVGFQHRRYDEAYLVGCTDFCPPGQLPPDSVVPLGGPVPTPYTVTRSFEAWEPGLELGVRLMPTRSMVIDVGGWFRLVRLDDPRSRYYRGDVEARLVAAAGIGW